MSSPPPIEIKAQHACRRCQRRKQRCDKRLPQCSRCATKSIHCDYRAIDDVQTSLADVQEQVAHGRLPIVEARHCCPDLSIHGQCVLLEAVCLTDIQPTGLVNCVLADEVKRILILFGADMHEISKEFFGTLHQSLPIVDCDRFNARLHLLPQFGSDAGFALLMLSVYVIMQKPCEGSRHSMQNNIYVATKRVFLALQATSHSNELDLLQAGLIIFMYEFGHDMHDQAYATLNICVALLCLVHRSLHDNPTTATKQMESDECRSAILVVYSVLSLFEIGNRSRKLLAFSEYPAFGSSIEKRAPHLASADGRFKMFHY
ncbi:hypothetical protein BKA60DRAFT_347223 [Fusarium oxysporum]|nr:hypothetical protein BKA60DRAFT_347223 [Fusarium oxysporum]